MKLDARNHFGASPALAHVEAFPVLHDVPRRLHAM
jgi:hypothetical protein